MTASELINIFLRLEMADKGETSDFLFDDGKGGAPFGITGVHIDEDGDLCLESDVRAAKQLNARELAEAVQQFDGDRTVYFLSIDEDGAPVLYNIKDGGTKERLDPALFMVPAGELAQSLRAISIANGQLADAALLHFESGTINFTINSIYTDPHGCLCLESNEIMELDDYPLSMIISELEEVDPRTEVYFFDDESRDYYGIYKDEWRIDDKGDVWIKVR